MSKLFTWQWDYGEQHAWAIADDLAEAQALLVEGDRLFEARTGRRSNDRWLPPDPTHVHDLGVHVTPRGRMDRWRTWGPNDAAFFTMVGDDLVAEPDLSLRPKPVDIDDDVGRVASVLYPDGRPEPTTPSA